MRPTQSIARMSDETVRERYVAREMLIAIVINAIFSAVFTYVTFGEQSSVQLWGWYGVAIDFVPQTLALTVITVVAATNVTRQAIKREKISIQLAPRWASWLPDNLGVRAIVLGIAATVVFGGLANGVLIAFPDDAISYGSVLLLKILYGAVVAAIVALTALRKALSERREPLRDCAMSED